MNSYKNLKEKLDEKEKGCEFSLHRISRFTQPCLLLLLSNESTYGYKRTLRKLEKEGYIKSFLNRGKGKRKIRHYKITPAGKILLEMWFKRIKERKRALEKFITLYKGGSENER